jgi:hypothetical protein
VSNDTHPDVARLLIDGYRRMTPEEKFQRVQELNETVLQFAAARIREQFAPHGEQELRLRLASLWLERDTMIRAFGWDPELHGR